MPVLRVARLQARPRFAASQEARWPSPVLENPLAEDNAVNQKLAIGLLQRMGHRVDLAVNGLEVLRMFREKRYDVILMDLQMPAMGGLQATGKIREIEGATGTHTPILAMTAHAAAEDALTVPPGWRGWPSHQTNPYGISQEGNRACNHEYQTDERTTPERNATRPKRSGI